MRSKRGKLKTGLKRLARKEQKSFFRVKRSGPDQWNGEIEEVKGKGGQMEWGKNKGASHWLGGTGVVDRGKAVYSHLAGRRGARQKRVYR